MVKILLPLILIILHGLYSAFHYSKQVKQISECEGKSLTIVGKIVSLPNETSMQATFHFLTKDNKKIILSWRHPPSHLWVGDEWQLNVKLKKVHGLHNLGGFNYENWAFQEGIIANGYVNVKGNNQFISHHFFMYPIQFLRELISEKIDDNLPASLTSPWIKTFVIGVRNHIPQSSWEVLRNTGTNHLMAIAGLHIGFVSGLIFMLVKFLWRQSYRLTCIMAADKIAAILSLICAVFYSALAGFSLPTERACIMVTVVLFFYLTHRKLSAWTAWYLALILVLLWNPLSILSESFWLSFGAVALIIYGVGGRLKQSTFSKWFGIQWVLAIGLLPFSIAFFQQFSFIAILANTISIPWVGFVIVPFSLLGVLFLFIYAPFGKLLLLFADKNLFLLWNILSYFSNLPGIVWYQFVPHIWIIISACVGIALLLLPRGVPGRVLGVVWLLPMLFYHPEEIKFGEVKFSLLDVGQGLSSIVQTKNHILIYDTGAKLSENYDMGESVVVPFLRAIHAKNIDSLVISHTDNDHVGGAAAILHRYLVEKIFSSDTAYFSKELPVLTCIAGNKWEWDGVLFEFLYPTKDSLNLDNDSSCVLKISTKKESLLLTGDIEKAAENDLLEHQYAKLASTILVAPHHGSKTSSQIDFISAVHPSYVLFAVGYRNRYHLPNNTIVNRYKNSGAKLYDSVNDGEVEIDFGRENGIEVIPYRKKT